MSGKQREMKGKQRGTERDMTGTEMKTRCRGNDRETKHNETNRHDGRCREHDSQRKNGTYMENDADRPIKCQGHEGGVERNGRDMTRTSWET